MNARLDLTFENRDSWFARHLLDVDHRAARLALRPIVEVKDERLLLVLRPRLVKSNDHIDPQGELAKRTKVNNGMAN